MCVTFPPPFSRILTLPFVPWLCDAQAVAFRSTAETAAAAAAAASIAAILEVAAAVRFCVPSVDVCRSWSDRSPVYFNFFAHPSQYVQVVADSRSTAATVVAAASTATVRLPL